MHRKSFDLGIQPVLGRSSSQHPGEPNGAGKATAEPGLRSIEVGERLGLQFIVVVYDAFLHRAMKPAGRQGDPLEEPERIHKVLAHAVHFEVSEEMRAAKQKAGKIAGSVWKQRPTVYQVRTYTKTHNS